MAPPVLTSEDLLTEPVSSPTGEPAWEVAFLFPPQGAWTEAAYFSLDTNRLVELVDGRLEVLPLPSLHHQLIVDFLHARLKAFLASWGKGGLAVFAPVPVRLRRNIIREPDVFFIAGENIGDLKKPPTKIDLAMEVASPGQANRERDYSEKRADYAAAGIAEYWIVDPEERRITVLALDGAAYREHGVFGPGTTATSVLLPGFAVPVDDCLAGKS